MQAQRIKFIKDEEDLQACVDQLILQCDYMKTAFELCGYPPLRLREGGFCGLADIVISQQLSVASARAISKRVMALMSTAQWHAEEFAKIKDEDLKSAGLSWPKIRTLRAIQSAMLSGELDFDALFNLNEHDALKQLVSIKGIGPWSAQIYLAFCMGYCDQFAAGDLALQIAAKELMGLDQRPTTNEIAKIAEELWKPNRSAAAYLLWAYYRKQIKSSSGMPI